MYLLYLVGENNNQAFLNVYLNICSLFSGSRGETWITRTISGVCAAFKSHVLCDCLFLWGCVCVKIMNCLLCRVVLEEVDLMGFQENQEIRLYKLYYSSTCIIIQFELTHKMFHI